MNPIFIALRGMAMGVAEVIPGVSGGTIAFITGIYERLLNCIKAFSPALLQTYKQTGFVGVWKAIDGTFLLTLFMGMGLGIGVGIVGVTHLLEHYPILVWAFFFGLIIASALYVGRQIGRWRVAEVVLLLLGAGVAYGITTLPTGEGSESLLRVFIAGAIAISALILPGISGSFMLLLMGMYTVVIPSLKDAVSTLALDKIILVATFAAGCLVGLLSFARLLSWTFKTYRSATFALLTGFMLGSLNKVWPWRIPTETFVKPDGEIKIVREANLLPSDFAAHADGGEPMLVAALVLMLVGFGLVFLMELLPNNKETD